MNNLISRDEAAKIVGVDRQTISNWAKKGILKPVPVTNKCFHFYKDQVQSLSDGLKEIAHLESQVEFYKKQLSSTIREYEDAITEYKKEIWLRISSKNHVGIVAELLEKCVGIMFPESRHKNFIYQFIKGKDTKSIAEENGLTPERVLQIIARGIRMLNCVDDYDKKTKENEELKKKNGFLEIQAKELLDENMKMQEELSKVDNSVIVKGYEPVTQYDLSTKIKDAGFSKRCINCFVVAEIDNIYDVVKKSKTDFLKYRNFGKRSLCEIEEFLENHGLWFDMDLIFRDGTFYVKK